MEHFTATSLKANTAKFRFMFPGVDKSSWPIMVKRFLVQIKSSCLVSPLTINWHLRYIWKTSVEKYNLNFVLLLEVANSWLMRKQWYMQRGVFRALSNIYGWPFSPKYSTAKSYYFHKKSPSLIFGRA